MVSPASAMLLPFYGSQQARRGASLVAGGETRCEGKGIVGARVGQVVLQVLDRPLHCKAQSQDLMQYPSGLS